MRHPLSKSAVGPVDVGRSPMQAALSDQAKADALRRAVQWGLFGTGAGVGVGLLRHVPGLLSPSTTPVDKMELTTGDVTIQPPDEDEDEPKPRFRKRADPYRDVVDAVIPTPVGEPDPSLLSPKGIRGDGQTNSWSVPWAMPAAAAAAVGGGVAGSALVKWLTRRRLEKDRDADLAAAEKEYESALGGVRKGASLDDAWAGLQKLATSETLGTMTGGYLTLASLLALLSGYGAYSMARKADPAQGMAAALDERTRLRAMHSPPPIRLALADDEDAKPKSLA